MISLEKLSPFCFGCEPLGGVDWGDVNIPKIERAIHRALEFGINFFDTAGAYGLGLSEERLSRILGENRHNVVIATKGGLSWAKNKTPNKRSFITRDSSPSAIKNDIDDSLRRLNIDCLPIFFIHWPDSKISIRATFEALQNIYDEGKIDAIGCSNFNAEQIKQACSVSEVAFIQVPHNLLNDNIDKKINNLCNDYNIKIIVYNVLANGLLSGKYDMSSVFPKNDRRTRSPLFQGKKYLNALKKVNELKIEAESENLTLAQYAIQSALKMSNIVSVILGIKNIRQLKENISGTKTLTSLN